MDSNLPQVIKEWCETADDHILRKTVQVAKRTKNKKSEYIKENKLAVTCCFKRLHLEFIKDPSNSEYSYISYESFLKRIPGNIVYPNKRTDLCELCLFSNRIKNKQNRTQEEKNLLILYENHHQNSILQRNSF